MDLSIVKSDVITFCACFWIQKFVALTIGRKTLLFSERCPGRSSFSSLVCIFTALPLNEWDKAVVEPFSVGPGALKKINDQS